jgi:anthranilate phosphoribosyltransferase
MLSILGNEVTPAQFGALMIALRLKGETPEEMAGFASAMREKVTTVTLTQPVVDTCGTGGDGSNSFNISTASAIVVAATGTPVAKHGNRAASSKCGSADVLEGLGVRIDLGPVDVARSIDATGFGFMFAPRYHPSMKFAAPLRPELGVRTVFNMLGPLTNPAGARRQIIGVPTPAFGVKVAEALARLGTEHSLVVSGDANMDELTLSGPSQVWEVRDGHVRHFVIHEGDHGLGTYPLESVRGGDVQTNIRIVTEALEGVEGAPLQAVILNAGAALYAADQVPSVRAGIDLAREAVRSGHARSRLDTIVAFGKTL